MNIKSIQLSIDFDSRRLARRTDPATSQNAAARVREFQAGHHDMILNALRRFEKAGAEQIAEATQLEAYSVRKRTAELCRKGLIKLTGETRLTASGRHERVWAIA